MNRERLLFSIGLARKAGKLLAGTDMVTDGIRNGKVYRVIASGDISENTKKRITDCCTYYTVPLSVMEISKEALGSAIGKPFAACVGITDENLSELISRNL